MNDPVHLDVTSLVADPLRSGIQRVERELIRHWPGPAPLIPCRFTPGGDLVGLPDKVLDVLSRGQAGPRFDYDAEKRVLGTLLDGARPLRAGPGARLLNIELFFEQSRADAYLRLAEAGWRVHWLIHDFMPWLFPDLFDRGAIRHCMHYLRALRGIGRVGFVSDRVRRDYASRVMRSPDAGGPVFPLGGDGLRLERQTFLPRRRDFVLLGTIEPRKNPLRAIEAFRLLWAKGLGAKGLDARLVLAGRIAANAPRERAAIAALADEPRLVFLDHPSDRDIREALRRARAVLFASEHEGFGLPPYEALSCGIPAIVQEAIPSMAALPPGGRIALERTDPDALAAAVERLMDDDEAALLWREAAALAVPGWGDFARSLAAWVQAPEADALNRKPPAAGGRPGSLTPGG